MCYIVRFSSKSTQTFNNTGGMASGGSGGAHLGDAVLVEVAAAVVLVLTDAALHLLLHLLVLGVVGRQLRQHRALRARRQEERAHACACAQQDSVWCVYVTSPHGITRRDKITNT